MKKLTHNFGAKTAAFLLLIIFAACGAASVLGIAFIYEGGAYEGNADFYESGYCDSLAYNSAIDVYYGYVDGGSPSELTSDNNFGYEIFETERPARILASGGARGDYGFSSDYRMLYESGGSTVEYTVRAYVAAKLVPGDKFYEVNAIFRLLVPMRWTLVIYLAVSVLLCILLLVFLFCAAGHRGDTDEIHPGFLDKIPLDIYAAVLVALSVCAVALCFENYWYSDAVQLMLIAAAILFCCLMALALLLSFATRVKLGRWWRNTLVYFCLRLCWRGARGLWRWMGRVIRSIPLVWRTGVLAAALVIINLMCAGMEAYFLMFAVDCLAGLALCCVALWLRRLKRGGECLAQGKLSEKVDTSRMLWDFKAHGENLNSIADGMTRAVDERLKSERMKTELITNVSHDIKTPLTSIINYVDLLQKEHTPQQEAEYLDVLDRQTKRLKKLTEDVVEASKASTGNVQMELMRTNLGEFIIQSVGEYTERLETGSLEPVLSSPKEQLYIMADGRLLWRVFDNILGNAYKYSQTGTRIYIDVRRAGARAVMTVKNISREKLNIPAEELMERFVRGDSARNSEGSGLGLNIARSLVELQGGAFWLEIDGDLFKVSISFPITDAPPLAIEN